MISNFPSTFTTYLNCLVRLLLTDVISLSRSCSDLFVTSSFEDIRVFHTPSQQELLRINIPNLVCFSIDIAKDGTSIVSGELVWWFLCIWELCFPVLHRAATVVFGWFWGLVQTPTLVNAYRAASMGCSPHTHSRFLSSVGMALGCASTKKETKFACHQNISGCTAFIFLLGSAS